MTVEEYKEWLLWSMLGYYAHGTEDCDAYRILENEYDRIA